MILAILAIFRIADYYPHNPKDPKYLKDPVILSPLPSV